MAITGIEPARRLASIGARSTRATRRPARARRGRGIRPRTRRTRSTSRARRLPAAPRPGAGSASGTRGARSRASSARRHAQAVDGLLLDAGGGQLLVELRTGAVHDDRRQADLLQERERRRQRVEIVAQHRAADLDHREALRVELREALEVLLDLLRAAPCSTAGARWSGGSGDGRRRSCVSVRDQARRWFRCSRCELVERDPFVGRCAPARCRRGRRRAR